MTDPLSALARSQPLALVLDLDETGVPLTNDAELLDRAYVLLFDALAAAGVQVVVKARKPRALLEELRRQARHVWWDTTPGCPIAWTRDQLDGTSVIAIGNDATLRAVRAPQDVAVAV